MIDEHLDPAEEARRRAWLGFHFFAVQAIDLYGADHPIALLARRIAQRTRYLLVVGEDPDIAEVRDRVITTLTERRERIQTLLAK